MLFLASLVDFSISSRDKAFEVTARFGFGRKSGDLGEVGRSALVKVMKVLDLFEGHFMVLLRFELVQSRFQRRPVRALTGDKFLEVDNHFLNSELIRAFAFV